MSISRPPSNGIDGESKNTSSFAATNNLSTTSSDDLNALSNYDIGCCVIASEWHFKPKGVIEVKRRFDEVVRKEGKYGDIRWLTDSHVFWLTSDYHLLFLQQQLDRITRAIIREEGGDDDVEESDEQYDDFENESDESAEVRFRSELIVKVSDWIRGDDDHLQSGNAEVDNTFYPKEILAFDHRTIWVDEGLNIDFALPDEELISVEASMNCSFVKSSSESKVYIGANDERTLQAVIAKLSVMASFKYMPSKSFHHSFYTESQERCKFTVKPFKNMNKKYIENTLMERKEFYQPLNKQFVVRACLFQPLKTQYLIFQPGKPAPAAPVQQGLPGKAASNIWAGFICNSRGTPDQDPERYFHDGYDAEIKRQEAQEAEEDKVDQEVVDKVPVLLDVLLNPTEKRSIAGWVGNVAQSIAGYDEKNSFVAAKNASTAHNSESSADSYNPPVTGAGDDLNEPAGSQVETIFTPTSPQTSLQDLTADTALDTQWTTGNEEGREDGNNVMPAREIANITNDLIDLGDPSQDTSQIEGFLNPCAIPFVSDVNYAQLASLDLSSSSTPEVNHLRLPSEDLYSLADPLVPIMRQGNQHPRPRLQSVDEASTRVFHQTMRQKAAKPQSPMNSYSLRADDPQKVFLKDIEGKFGALMAPTRGFSGDILVRLEFGRILLGNLPSKMVGNTGDRQHFADSIIKHLSPAGLRPGDGPELNFTNIVSTLEADSNFLLNIRDKEDTRVWTKEALEWQVVYEFECEDLRTNALFTVEVDSETFKTRIKVPKDFGGVYVHGTMRNWDCRISAIGYMSDQEIRNRGDQEVRNGWEFYGDLADEITNTLFIPPGNHKPNHAIEISNKLLANFEIFSMKLRKTKTYLSRDKKSKLHITEVDKSCGEKLTVKSKDTHVYIFREEKKTEEDKIETCWQELSITSCAIQEILKENQKLEIGDQTKWTIQNLASKDTSESLIRPACALIAQMDGVGYYNDNERVKEIKASGIQNVETSYAAFW